MIISFSFGPAAVRGIIKVSVCVCSPQPRGENVSALVRVLHGRRQGVLEGPPFRIRTNYSSMEIDLSSFFLFCVSCLATVTNRNVSQCLDDD